MRIMLPLNQKQLELSCAYDLELRKLLVQVYVSEIKSMFRLLRQRMFAKYAKVR